MRPLSDISAALMLLTRLPVPPAGAPSPVAAWAWPLAGVVVGALSGAASLAALWIGLGPGLAAGLGLVVQVMATGGLHEDGLADSADGMWGGKTPQARLAIMRDSRIGSYGTLALILSLLLRWQAMALLAGAGLLLPALIIAGGVSRLPMAVLMTALAPARSDGLSRLVGRPPVQAIWVGLAICVALVLVLAPGALLAIGLVAPLPALWLGRLARTRLGGQTGDILGASQQITEIATLLTLCAFL